MANYKGLAVGAFGGSRLWQDAVGNDALTITAITAATADFLVCETAGGGEVFVVEDDGIVIAEGEISARGGITLPAATDYIKFTPPTTAPTGLDQWDLFVIANNGGTGPQLALCTTGDTLIYNSFHTTTLGRTSGT